MAPVRPVDSAGQAGDTQQVHNKVPGSLNDFSRPCNKSTSKTQTAEEENSSQSLAKLLEICQELTNNTPAQRHTN
jgi:hypothetical protein